jgi:hypothetical protein
MIIKYKTLFIFYFIFQFILNDLWIVKALAKSVPSSSAIFYFIYSCLSLYLNIAL